MTSSLGLDFAAMSDPASKAVAPMNMVFNAFWFLRFALKDEWRIFAGKFPGKA